MLRNHPLSVEIGSEVFAPEVKMEAHQYSMASLDWCRTDSRNTNNVKGDGNCFFNSASVAISGNELMAIELNVRSCIELAVYFDYYLNHFQYQYFSLVSDDLEMVCLACATDGEYSSMSTIQALASVLRRQSSPSIHLEMAYWTSSIA